MTSTGGLGRSVLAALVVIGSACGSTASSPSASAAPAATPAPTATPAHQVKVSLVATQLAIGTYRFPIGVADHNSPVANATVHVRVYSTAGATQTLKGDSDAPYHDQGLSGHGLYVAWFHFDVAGVWQAQIDVRLPDGTQAAVPEQFGVRMATEVPMVGQPAPRSQNQTAAQVPDVSYIDSGQPPDDMHAISIADAIAQHRPTLVVFATPAFCTSATCGPQIQAIQALEPAYRDRLTFIHVEVYTDIKPDPNQRQVSPVMKEWHLQTEPWVFLVNRAGSIAAVFEGAAATDEVKQAADQLLAAG